ncbi:alpha/beta hydrolase family protein [Solicola gregarius]|uniref:Alpha/beta hydrolase n=1 Tax=Solicola gregarius TaxID=2908642 RepID=A0AA46TGB3_9ACTN|nr:hypothetical protein [Solicola gregarius]UYM04581.1 hypothetical protein L0C25_18905 [Solicola gregarius]
MTQRLLTYAAGAVMTASLIAAPAATATTNGAPGADTADRSGELALPAPRGPLPIGSTAFHLVDSGRPDPWVPESGDRELMVSMFYPTYAPLGRRAPYMTAAESNAYIDAQRDSGAPIPDDIPDTILRTVHTGAVRDAPALPRPGGRPLVVLSPGFSLSRSSMTGLATDLASRGYVVATIDHAYESYGIEMPGGRLLPCEACATEDYAKIPRGRSEDVSFVLDRLLSDRSPWRYARTIDSDHIGMAGHSIGGNTAATAMSNDRRVDAGVNLDGTFFAPVRGALDRPFMLLGDERLHAPDGGDESWPRDWSKFTDARYWFSVTDGGHFTFIDFPVLREQLGMEPGPISGRRSMDLTRTYVNAFFDEHLRGRDRPVLDGPSPQWPEVNAHHE